MATHGTPTPRVLVLGHSFIRRLRDFIERKPGDLDLAFNLKPREKLILATFLPRTR